jgi:alkanesulfonate monooxygenase SsuD/methylene tetrahydromethanopterin reductase-like flavin-dependent oxidoreductase (luciferase family)
MSADDVTFGIGLVTAQNPSWDPRSQAEILRDVLQLCRSVEGLGLDAVWFSEHHFFDDSYLSSVFPLLGAISAQTSRLRLGTAVLPAHLHNAIRLAEDAATVDLLSGERLILGLGHGWRTPEFEAFQVDKMQLGAKLDHVVSGLRKAWSADGALRGVAVTPKPTAATGVPIWIGGKSPAMCRRAGALADGFISPSAGVEQIASYAALVAEGAAAAGRHLDDFEFGAMLPIFPWDGTELPAQVHEGVLHVYWQYARMADRGFTPPPSAVPDAEERKRASAAAESLQSGGPGQLADIVADAIRAVRTAIPTAKVHIVARSWWPGVPVDILARSARVFVDEVAPAALAASQRRS